MPFRRQTRGHIRRAPVLPDDGPVQRLARRRVPQHRGLALVGDAHGGEAIHAARLPHHLATGLQGRAPDLGRVMLDPARLREVLGQFDLANGDGMKGALGRHLKRNRPRRGRALVDGEDKTVHGARLFQVSIKATAEVRRLSNSVTRPRQV
ncbi:hypothetical protein D3C72_1123860 [compost metagenome]